MDQAKGESAVVTSAVIVAGTYTYRKLTEHVTEKKAAPVSRSPSHVAQGIIGTGELLPIGPWITGFGVTFIVISVLTTMSPSVGGSAAILVATGCLLGNGQALFQDLHHATRQQKESAEVAQTPVPKTTNVEPQSQVRTVRA